LPPDHWLHDPEAGGGRIIGEACHFVDLLMFLAASIPIQLHAQALPSNATYREDNVVAQIKFANESLAAFSYVANGDKRTGKEHLEIFGGGATVIIEDFRSVIVSRRGLRKHVGRWWGRQDKGHLAEMRAFVEAVRSGSPSPIPFQELLTSTAVTFGILESLRTGQSIRMEERYSC